MTPIWPQTSSTFARLAEQSVSNIIVIWGLEMSVMNTKDLFKHREVIDLVMRERETSLSAREWKHRLAGYGYAIKETVQGQLVESLPHRKVICVLPEEAMA